MSAITNVEDDERRKRMLTSADKLIDENIERQKKSKVLHYRITKTIGVYLRAPWIQYFDYFLYFAPFLIAGIKVLKSDLKTLLISIGIYIALVITRFIIVWRIKKQIGTET